MLCRKYSTNKDQYLKRRYSIIFLDVGFFLSRFSKLTSFWSLFWGGGGGGAKGLMLSGGGWGMLWGCGGMFWGCGGMFWGGKAMLWGAGMAITLWTWMRISRGAVICSSEESHGSCEQNLDDVLNYIMNTMLKFISNAE